MKQYPSREVLAPLHRVDQEEFKHRWVVRLSLTSRFSQDIRRAIYLRAALLGKDLTFIEPDAGGGV